MTAKTNRPYLWSSLLIITLTIALIFILPQLPVLVLASLMAIVFYPLYKRLQRKKGYGAALVTLLISFIIVIVPLVIVLLLTTLQLANVAETLSHKDVFAGLVGIINHVTDATNSLLGSFSSLRLPVDANGIGEFARTAGLEIARTAGRFALNVAGGIPQFIISVIVYSFVFTELLVNGHKAVELIYAISPFDRPLTKRYIERVDVMATAMVKGQLLISMAISFIAACLLIPLGFGPYFFVLFILFTILNLVPLGCGIVMFPLIIYSGLTGQFLAALIVMVLYMLTSNIDSVLRPIFTPREVRLSTALTMIATFCGIAYFGILGVVYGPIIMVLIVTALSMYTEQRSRSLA